MARGRTSIPTLALLLPTGAVVMATATSAEAATPTYYNSLAAFQAEVTQTVTDNYQNPAYVFQQNNAAMNAVLGETDYFTTGFADWNLVSGGVYCAGCNGSFELSFQTTSVGNAAGVNGVGMNIMFNDPGLPYFAYITFADGTTANIQLPAAGSFWGVAAPERIERIHFGLSMGGFTQAGSFGIDNLIIGDGNIGTCMVDADCIDDLDPCTTEVCSAGLCNSVPNDGPCDDENPCTDEACVAGVCTPQFNSAPCDDAEVCTENDVCTVGMCQGTLVACNDGNACTTDFCDFGVGCDAVNNNLPCDDANPCTEEDQCAAGTCDGSPTNCADEDPCTADSCDPALGCVSEEIPGCCTEDADCGDQACDVETNTCADPSTGGESSGGGESTSGAPTDTDSAESGPGDTGADDTGGNSGVATTSGPATDGQDTDGTGGSGETSGSLDPADPDFSACNCTNTPPGQGRLWWLMLPLGLFLRRRRAA